MKNSRTKAAASAQHFNNLPDNARVKSTVALVILGVDALSTLWRWEKTGRIPPSKKVAGSRYKTWAAGEIREVLKNGLGG